VFMCLILTHHTILQNYVIHGYVKKHILDLYHIVRWPTPSAFS